MEREVPENQKSLDGRSNPRKSSNEARSETLWIRIGASFNKRIEQALGDLTFQKFRQSFCLFCDGRSLSLSNDG